MKFDFVSVGDITTDAFIRIKRAEVIFEKKHHHTLLCVINGAKVPYEFVKVVSAVGNSPNAAVAASRLGLRSALVADVGDDDNGREDIASLKKNKVDTRFVDIQKGMASNYHYVLWHEAERTILIKHENYKYAFPNIGTPKLVYFSSVGEDSLPYHYEIAKYLKKHPKIKFAFQPGTFQLKLGFKKLKDMYDVSHLFFCNVQEAQQLLNDYKSKPQDLAKRISELGPKISVVTDGPRGAYAFDGARTWFMPPYPDPKPPYDRTGAGDSFSSTFAVAIAEGRPVEEALTWGPINSMSVVQYVGAQEGLLTRSKLMGYLKKRPKNYEAKVVK